MNEESAAFLLHLERIVRTFFSWLGLFAFITGILSTYHVSGQVLGIKTNKTVSAGKRNEHKYKLNPSLISL